MPPFRSIGAALNPDGTGTEPVDWRKTLAGLVTSAGVLPGFTAPLVEGVEGAMQYVVHAAVWATSRGASDGVHLWGNDGDYTVDTDASPGSGLERIDVIYALHTSAGDPVDVLSEAIIDVEVGDAGSVAIAPVLPTGALELARKIVAGTEADTVSGSAVEQTATVASVRGTGFGRYARHRTSGQAIPTTSYTTVGSWNESVDTAGNPSDFSGGGATYTTGFRGWVRVRARVSFDGNDTGIRAVRLLRGGTELVTSRVPSAGAAAVVDAEATWEGPVVHGDAFSVQALQNSGVSLNTVGTPGATGFFIERLA